MTAKGFLESMLLIFLTTKPCLDFVGMSDSFVRSSPSKMLSRSISDSYSGSELISFG